MVWARKATRNGCHRIRGLAECNKGKTSRGLATDSHRSIVCQNRVLRRRVSHIKMLDHDETLQSSSNVLRTEFLNFQ